jgi:protein phosphatase
LGSLQKAFQTFDTNNDGVLSYEELFQVFKNYNLGLTKDQIYDFIKSMDTNHDGGVDYSEFSQRFKIKFDETKEEVQKVLSNLAELIISKMHQIEEAFKITDLNKNGELDLEEFRALLAVCDIFDDGINDLFEYIDENGDGAISFSEFQEIFNHKSVKDEKSKLFSESLLQRILSALFQSKTKLKVLFKRLDQNGDGKISVEELKIGIEAMNLSLDGPLSFEQVENLHKMIDIDGDGSIDYHEFLSSFKVIDSESKIDQLMN